jgi:hypothetical protein
MSKQVTIYFKDGTKDWIDPVEEDDIDYSEKYMYIDNGCYVYKYSKEEVHHITVEEI